jgi:hypothetical protein
MRSEGSLKQSSENVQRSLGSFPVIRMLAGFGVTSRASEASGGNDASCAGVASRANGTSWASDAAVKN